MSDEEKDMSSEEPSTAEFREIFEDPDMVGTTEYRAVYAAILSGAFDKDSDTDEVPTDEDMTTESIEHAVTMLDEIIGYAKSAKKGLRALLKKKLSAAQRALEQHFPVHRCDNCETLWVEDELRLPIPDLEQRVDPGGVMPSGECKGEDCGALCYPSTHKRYFESLRREMMQQSTLRIAATQATGCAGADGAWDKKYKYILAVDTTSSAGDWSFIVSEDGFYWYLLTQTNNYPKPGFTHTVHEDNCYEGTFSGAYKWAAAGG